MDFPTASATQATFGGDSDSFIATLPAPTRTISYSYDGLSRLIGASESPGTTYAYSYDLAGNRTSVTVDGVVTSQPTFNAADQLIGWSYDAAGNLLSDGTTTSTYDALNRLLTTSAAGQSRSNSYNGDGVLVAQSTSTQPQAPHIHFARREPAPADLLRVIPQCGTRSLRG